MIQASRGRLIERLQDLAREHHLPLDDLLDWYGQDIEDMTRMDDSAIAWLVADYARFRGTLYRAPTTPTTPTTAQQAAANLAMRG